MNRIYLLAPLSFFFICTKTVAQVGIGTTTPNAASALHVDVGANPTNGLLVTGAYSASATVPNLGVGSRLMFYPGKGAFRAGIALGTEWDNVNVGSASVAMGYSTYARGTASTALGDGNQANGTSSVAMGANASATADYSTALGTSITASGILSMAFGHAVNTNNQRGAFIMGDSNPLNSSQTDSGFPDEFVARFNNGYYFLTSGNVNRFGVSIGHFGNAWVSICDKNRKENFEELNGEDVLQKLSKINFTSWNYKMQDPNIYRHYGIMAQDFYQAFGHDKFGSIGNDTTVNPIDMIGIDMTAIKALEKRTENLKGENLRLQQSVTQLEIAFNEQKKLSDTQQTKIDKLELQMKELLKR